jgi:hypothetical protein
VQFQFSSSAMMSLTFGEGKSSAKEVVSLTNDITKETIAGVINKCTKNEQIDDDSKIIISNVLPNMLIELIYQRQCLAKVGCSHIL